MKPSLDDLVRKALQIEMTLAQRERQRRSFAYGNAHLENDRITREMVDRVAETVETPDA